MLIGIGHAAGVGKDEAGKLLVERHNFKRLAFADILRKVAYDSNPMVRHRVDLVGWDDAKRSYPEVRKYLIDLGNAVRKHIGEDVWIDAVFRQIKDGHNYVITDVRYPNEWRAITGWGGMDVKITRPGVEPGKNVADQALAGFDGWGVVIENDGTIEDLAAKLAALIGA